MWSFGLATQKLRRTSKLARRRQSPTAASIQSPDHPVVVSAGLQSNRRCNPTVSMGARPVKSREDTKREDRG